MYHTYVIPMSDSKKYAVPFSYVVNLAVYQNTAADLEKKKGGWIQADKMRMVSPAKVRS